MGHFEYNNSATSKILGNSDSHSRSTSSQPIRNPEECGYEDTRLSFGWNGRRTRNAPGFRTALAREGSKLFLEQYVYVNSDNVP